MLTAIIIDDEKRAREVLAYAVKRHCADSVTIVAEANSLLTGVEAIKKHKPQLVFLDIEMPDYLGTEITNFFEKVDFEIIFVTAYSKYAIKAFELSATDYLLKPVDPERLKASLQKVIDINNDQHKTERIKILENLLNSGKSERITIPYVGGYHILKIDELIMVKADRAYSKFILTDQEILVSKNLSQVEKLLEGFNHFFRAHRSFLINLNHLEKHSYKEGEISLTNNIKAQLSQEKAKQLMEVVNQK